LLPFATGWPSSKLWLQRYAETKMGQTASLAWMERMALTVQMALMGKMEHPAETA
jgi:hypothetical protein